MLGKMKFPSLFEWKWGTLYVGKILNLQICCDGNWAHQISEKIKFQIYFHKNEAHRMSGKIEFSNLF